MASDAAASPDAAPSLFASVNYVSVAVGVSVVVLSVLLFSFFFQLRTRSRGKRVPVIASIGTANPENIVTPEIFLDVVRFRTPGAASEPSERPPESGDSRKYTVQGLR